jgi:hypothetical protein
MHRRVGGAHSRQHLLGRHAAVHQPDPARLAVLPFDTVSIRGSRTRRPRPRFLPLAIGRWSRSSFSSQSSCRTENSPPTTPCRRPPSALLPRRADQRSEIRGHQIPVTRTGLLPQRTAARRRALSGAGRCALCRCHQVASEDNPTPLLQDGAGGRPRGAAPSPREGTRLMTARITRSALANRAFLRREGHSGSHVTRRCWEMDSNLWFLRRMDTSTELIDDNLTLRHDLRSSVLVPGF